MRETSGHLWGVALLFVCGVAVNAQGEEAMQPPLDSLLGKYEGTLQVHMTRTLEYAYQAEIVSVDASSNSVSLVAQCSTCEVKSWKRNDCRITEAKEEIKFVCKLKTSDEQYVYKNDTLRVTGQGRKWPYSISAKKVVK